MIVEHVVNKTKNANNSFTPKLVPVGTVLSYTETQFEYVFKPGMFVKKQPGSQTLGIVIAVSINVYNNIDKLLVLWSDIAPQWSD